MTACPRVSVLAALVSQSLVARAGVPVCNHDTMADNAFCFPPEYNKVTHHTFFKMSLSVVQLVACSHPQPVIG